MARLVLLVGHQAHPTKTNVAKRGEGRAFRPSGYASAVSLNFLIAGKHIPGVPRRNAPVSEWKLGGSRCTGSPGFRLAA